jgi:hypothetical protein
MITSIPGGEWGYDWQTSEEYAAFASQQIAKRLSLIVGMQISPRFLQMALRLVF